MAEKGKYVVTKLNPDTGKVEAAIYSTEAQAKAKVESLSKDTKQVRSKRKLKNGEKSQAVRNVKRNQAVLYAKIKE